MTEEVEMYVADHVRISAALYVNEISLHAAFLPKKEALPFLQRRIEQIREQIHFSHEIDLTVIKAIGEVIAKLQEPVN